MTSLAPPQQSTLAYFKWAFVVTAIGLALGLWLGFATEHTIAGALKVFFICCVLAVLEISLSFDNAIVNANKLKDMTPVWQHRFLTWGIVIAVFGMRDRLPAADRRDRREYRAHRRRWCSPRRAPMNMPAS